MIRSYFAKYRSTDGKTLLGGVLHGQTSRFQSRADAQQRLDDIKELNGAHCEGEIHASKLPPEIFIHCGSMSQAIGGQCFRCHKVLTAADAKQAKAIQAPMPIFEIEQYELHSIKFRVEATSEAEAIAKLLAGKAEPVDQSQELIEVADAYGMATKEHQGLVRALRKLGVKVGKVIPSIRGVEEVEGD